MPAFDTPGPISVTITMVSGYARVIASDRADTVVEVSPTDRSHTDDVKAAAQTRVEYSHGTLQVIVPRQWKHYSPFSGGGSIDVTIELPSGSRVQGDTSMGDLHAQGSLGECRFSTSAGHIWLEEAGPVHLKTSTGNVNIAHVVGDAEVTGAGELRIREIDGTAVIKNLNGGIWVGVADGDLRCSSADGDITVDHANAAVTAKTANGDIRVGDVVRGAIAVQTASGELEVGIREGTAALLDVRSQFGNVRTALTASDGPEPSDETVTVRARTAHGDIVIRRS